MPVYAVRYNYTDDVALRDEARSSHRDYLNELAVDGVILMAGRLADDGDAGGLLIFRVEDSEALAGLIERDPFVARGIVREMDTREWLPVIGQLVDSL